jgi:ketosteroid isomerase-like protein
MASTNEQIVQSFLSALSNEGLDAAVRKYASPSVVWWTLGVGEIQQRFSELIAAFGRHFDEGGITIEVHGTTSEGDRVAVEAESHARLKNGSKYNNHYHFLFELRDEKIVHIKEYHDTQHASIVLAPILADIGL